jgi:hypothetical protein
MKLLPVALILCSLTAQAEFAWIDDGKTVTLTEAGKPVFTYHYTMVEPPEGVDPRFRRTAYLHPLYGLHGEVLTEDFPEDHYHHRGVFWAWPECTVGDRRLDVWSMKDARQVHERFLVREVGTDQAVLEVQNAWVFDDSPGEPQIRETVRITTHPAAGGKRALDFTLRFDNVSGKTITFLGAKDKGYGGLCFRPDARRKPMHFMADDGPVAEDQLRYDTPWADVSFERESDGREDTPATAPQSGVAIIQHPDNPGYPHPGWMFRHYAFLCVAWPHEQTHVLQAGDHFELKYRLLVHDGTAAEANVAKEAEAYALP